MWWWGAWGRSAAAPPHTQTGAGEGSRTPTPLRAPDFESGSSASSDTPASGPQDTSTPRVDEARARRDGAVAGSPWTTRPAAGILWRDAPRPTRPHRSSGLPHLPRHDDIRRPVRRGDVPRDPRPRRGRRHHVPRYRRRLPDWRHAGDGRPHRGDPRPVAARPPPRLHRRHQVLRRHRPPALGRGTSRKHVLDAIEGSLRRLGTDYVDLYQLHHPDPRRRSTRRCARSTTSCARARRATSAARTTSRGGWRARSGAASSSASRASTPSSRATTCCSARSSASCCRCAGRRASA